MSAVDTVPKAAEATLDVEGLRVTLMTGSGPREVVRGVDLMLERGDTVAVVGESGCGKSTLIKSILGLVDVRTGSIAGSVRFQGQELVGAGEAALQDVRGVGISMVFQDATDSLDPVFTVGYQIEEVLRHRLGLDRAQAKAEAIRLLADVDVPDPERRLKDYPHQLSGGLKQRVAVAVAIASDPDLLLADEPTTALDVTVQAEVLRVLHRLVDDRGMSLIFVTHDLNVARRVAERMVVMYAGQLVEEGLLQEVLEHPAHPYTLGLKHSEPVTVAPGERLRPIPGSPPPAFAEIKGCAFAPRCPFARDLCRTVAPELVEVAPGRKARCHFAKEVLRAE